MRGVRGAPAWYRWSRWAECTCSTSTPLDATSPNSPGMRSSSVCIGPHQSNLQTCFDRRVANAIMPPSDSSSRTPIAWTRVRESVTFSPYAILSLTKTRTWPGRRDSACQSFIYSFSRDLIFPYVLSTLCFLSLVELFGNFRSTNGNNCFATRADTIAHAGLRGGWISLPQRQFTVSVPRSALSQ